MKLLRAELLRARSRRVSWAVPLALLGLVAFIVIVSVLQDQSWDVPENLPAAVGDVAAYVAWLFAAIGASLLGAESSNGGMTRVLAVEPRRVRVVLAKLSVAGVVCAAGALVLAVGTVGLMVLAAAAGPFDGNAEEILTSDLASSCASVVLGATLAGMLGGVAGLLGRSTTVGVVALTIVLIVIEPLLGGLVSELEGRGPGFTMIGVMGGPNGVAASVVGEDASWLPPLLWTAGLALLGAFVMRRRDVVDGT